MLRRALMLLLALPLLSPPGFCLCRLEAFAPRQRQAERAATSHAPTKPKCRCCRPLTKVAPHAKAAPCPDGSCPVVPHVPGCPASPVWQLTHAGRPAEVCVAGDCLPPVTAGAWDGLPDDVPLSMPPVTSSLLAPRDFPLFSCNFRC